ncbi:cytidylyltransferase domain-containing protein [Shewanella sp. 30m-9]
MNIIAIIGARLNSSRLPGKHLLPLAGKPIIQHIQNRLEKCETLTDIVLATTLDDYNQPLIDWANHNSQVVAYSGDVNDLMGRINRVVEQYQADLVVYICGDCPLIDPGFIDHAVNALRQSPESNSITLDPSVSSIHEGMAFYTRQGWNSLFANSLSEMEKEHVGYADKRACCLNATVIQDSDDFSGVKHRISVDTDADYRFMQQLYQRWYLEQPADSIVSLSWVMKTLIAEGSLRQVNAHVTQKKANKKYQSISLYSIYDAEDDAIYQLSVKLGAALQERYAFGTQLHVLANELLESIQSQNCLIYNDKELFISALENDDKALGLCLFPNGQQLAKKLSRSELGHCFNVELSEISSASIEPNTVTVTPICCSSNPQQNTPQNSTTSNNNVIEALSVNQLKQLITSLL